MMVMPSRSFRDFRGPEGDARPPAGRSPMAETLRHSTHYDGGLHPEPSVPEVSPGRHAYRVSRRSGSASPAKDMRKHRNLRRFPHLVDHEVIHHERRAL
jgi:hypothetical protein